MGDDRNGGDLETMQPSAPISAANRGDAQGEHHQCHGRRQGEAGPGRERPEIARARQPDRQSDLAAGRTGQKLAERDEIGVGALIQPFAPGDELFAEVP